MFSGVEPVPFVPSEVPEVIPEPLNTPPVSNCVRRACGSRTFFVDKAEEKKAGNVTEDVDVDSGASSGGSRSRTHSGSCSPSLPETLSLVGQDAGRDSTLARKLTVDLFSRAMQKINGVRTEAPLQSMTLDRKFSLTRCQINVAMNMANGSTKTC